MVVKVVNKEISINPIDSGKILKAKIQTINAEASTNSIENKNPNVKISLTVSRMKHLEEGHM